MGDIQGAFSNSVSNARFVNVTISNLTVLSDSATEMQGAFIGEGLNVCLSFPFGCVRTQVNAFCACTREE